PSKRSGAFSRGSWWRCFLQPPTRRFSPAPCPRLRLRSAAWPTYRGSSSPTYWQRPLQRRCMGISAIASGGGACCSARLASLPLHRPPAAVLASRVPHVPIRRTERFRPDIVGALLFCGATFALLFALSSGGHRFAWSSWFLWILLGGAVVGYLLLVAWEQRVTDPVIP